ncbi:16S rRNA (cytosine(1402)-N(4))-methyltransferase RsmH [Candidatus Kaiserbacteria bacterium]|nr:MAG: 16S rRNA (cytosine(1402)-N(4))-methyltransferase RsmH [Candidatus Kaiserbacteria bacterium]
MQSHKTVLTDEAVDALAINDSSVVVDATLGSSGHAKRIIETLGSRGVFVGIDADVTAITKGTEVLRGSACTLHLCNGNFRTIDSILEQLHIEHADAILADLGWRMEQFSGNGKGFSFQVDEPLLMTFGDPKDYVFTARDIVNEWDEENLINILRGYGEERFAGRIARHIVEARAEKPIETTFELVAIIESAVPAFYKRARIHCATRTFQALRITVNDEFLALEDFIKKSVALLSPHGRLAVITFHSIEDRIVKHLFKNLAHDHIGIVHTKKPIIASPEELQENPRARSAKLRIFEKHEEV